MRHLAYPGTDVVFIAFSIMSRTSWENIKTSWLKEKNQHMKSAKVIKLLSISSVWL